MKTGRLVYLSYSISEATPVYGGGESLTIIYDKRISTGNSSNTSIWKFNNHTGTHLDAPKHFFDDGMTVDQYEADFWICNNVQVIHCDIEEPKWIVPEDLSCDINEGIDCLIIKTGFYRFRGKEAYYRNNPGISPELGAWLRSKYSLIKFIGFDFISVTRFTDRDRGREAHRALLCPFPPGKPILPIEDMNLSQLEKGLTISGLMVIPLRVVGSDGAPVTVLAEVT